MYVLGVTHAVHVHVEARVDIRFLPLLLFHNIFVCLRQFFSEPGCPDWLAI